MSLRDAWPKKSGLLKGVIPMHLAVLVLTSSATELETAPTKMSEKTYVPICCNTKGSRNNPSSSRRS